MGKVISIFMQIIIFIAIAWIFVFAKRQILNVSQELRFAVHPSLQTLADIVFVFLF